VDAANPIQSAPMATASPSPHNTTTTGLGLVRLPGVVAVRGVGVIAELLG